MEVAMNNTESNRHIWEAWHRTVMTRDLEGLSALYAPDAIFESPAVWLINRQSDGILRGRQAIHDYFAVFFKKLDVGSREWHRSDTFFSQGSELVWEYPRETPSGDQNEIVESIDVTRDGFIGHHRVYWGWVGLRNLTANVAPLVAAK
jgi:steroid delta-isomerase